MLHKHLIGIITSSKEIQIKQIEKEKWNYGKIKTCSSK